jgi:hypothetical protein
MLNKILDKTASKLLTYNPSFYTKIVYPYEDVRKLILPFILKRKIDDFNSLILLKKIKEINSCFKNYKGVNVIVAPPKSGITTNLKLIHNNYIDFGGNSVYFDNLKSEDEFFNYFGGKHSAPHLLYIMPQNSRIIIDNLNDIFKKDLYRLVLQLMTENSLYQNSSILVATSNISSAEKLLKLNNGTKIYLTYNPDTFKWNHNDILDYIRKIDIASKYNEECINKILQLGILAGNPEFINYLCSHLLDIYGIYSVLYDDHKIIKYSETKSNINTLNIDWDHYEHIANLFDKQWKEFEIFNKSYLIYGGIKN